MCDALGTCQQDEVKKNEKETSTKYIRVKMFVTSIDSTCPVAPESCQRLICYGWHYVA